MSKESYLKARSALCDSVRRKDFDMAKAIQKLILYFYKPMPKGRVDDSIQDLPEDPCLDGGA